MKKFLVMLLAFAMVVCFAACDDGSDTSSTPATSSEATSSEAVSSEAVSSEESSEAESSEVESSEAESSEEESSNLTEGGDEIAEFISQFVSYEGTIGTGTVGVKTTGAKSIRLTSLNVGAVDGVAGVLGFNSDYEEADIYSADGTYDNYEIFVFEYDHESWGCKLTESYGLDAEDKNTVAIPEDGFVIAVHSHFADYITAIKAATETDIFTPYGFRSTSEMDAIAVEGTPTIDGVINDGEWGDAVWFYNDETAYISYEQFDNKVPDDGYYSTATVYLNYDSENLYLGVVVDSPYHYNNFTPGDCGGMYDQECIQVNICSADPKGEYIMNNWDNHEQHNGNASNAGILRQYGFGVNTETKESLSCVWMPGGETAATVSCSRNDDQTTVYEVAIPFSEISPADAPVVGEAGTVIGVSISINSGREGFAFLNYYMRDGGGIIGRNDWSKIPQVSFVND